MSESQEDFKGQLILALSSSQYTYRTVDQLAKEMGMASYNLLRFCRENKEFTVSPRGQKTYVALKSKLEEETQEAENKLKNQMEGGEESEQDLPPAGVEPISYRKKPQKVNNEVLAKIGQAYMLLNQCSAALRGQKAVLLNQTLKDLEALGLSMTEVTKIEVGTSEPTKKDTTQLPE